MAATALTIPVDLTLDGALNSLKKLTGAYNSAEKQVHGKPITPQVDTKPAEAKVKSLGDRIKESLESAASGIKGFSLDSVLGGIGGGAMIAGLGAAKEAFEAVAHAVGHVFEAGLQSIESNEHLRTTFESAGLGGGALERQMKATGAQATELGLRFATSGTHIKEISSEAAFLGGVTGKTNADITQLALGIEKLSQGEVNASQAVRVFTKGVNDPEAAAGLGRLATKMPALATALKGAKSPAEALTLAMQQMGPGMKALEKQAKGPSGAIENLKLRFGDLEKAFGVLLVRAATPIFAIFNRVTDFIATVVVPAIKSLEPVVLAIAAPFTDLANGIYDLFANLAPIALPLIAVFSGLLSPLLSIGVAFGVVMAVVQILIGVLKPVTAFFGELLSSVTGATDGFGSFWTVIKENVWPILQQIGQVLQAVGELIGTMIVLPLKIVITYSVAVVKALFNIVSGLLGFKGGTETAGKATSTFHAILNGVRTALDYVKAGIDAAKAVFTEFGRIVSDVGTIIGDISFANFGTQISKLISVVGGAGARMGKAASDGFSNSVEKSKAVRAFDDVFDSIEKETKERFGKAGDKQNAETKVARDEAIRKLGTQFIGLKAQFPHIEELLPTELGDAIQKLKDDFEELGTVQKDVMSKGTKAAFESFTKDLVEIRKTSQKAIDDEAAAAIQNQQDRERKALQSSISQTIQAADDKLKELSKKIDDAVKEKKTLTIAVVDPNTGKEIEKAISAGELRKKIESDISAQKNAIRAKGEADARALEAKIVLDNADRERKTAEEEAKNALEINKRLQESLKANDLKSVTERARLQREAFTINAALEVENAITNSSEFRKGVEALQQQIRDKALRPEDFAVKLDELRRAIKATSPGIVALYASQEAQRVALSAAANLEIERARINSTESGLRRETDLRKLESRKQFDQEQADFAGNEQLLAASFVKYRASLRDIELEHLRQTDAGYAASIQFRESLQKQFTAFTQNEDDKQLSDSLDSLDKKREAALDDQLLRKTSYEQYTNDLNKLDAERADAQQKYAKQSLNIWTSLFSALNDTLSKLTDVFTKQAQSSVNGAVDAIQAYQDRVSEVARSVAASTAEAAVGPMEDLADVMKRAGEATASAGDAVTAATEKAYGSALIMVGTMSAQMIVQGKNVIKSIVLAALEGLKAIAPIYVAGIFGKTIAEGGAINPLSYILAGLAIGAFEALVSFAESKIAGFEEGGRIRGGKRLIQVNEAGEEGVLNARGLRKHPALFDAMNQDNDAGIRRYVVEKWGHNIVIGDDQPASGRHVADAVNKLGDRLEIKLDELKTEITSNIGVQVDMSPMRMDGDDFTAHHVRTQWAALKRR